MSNITLHNSESLHVKPEYEAAQRRVKAINGNIFLALYLVPGMPIFGRISLFLLTAEAPKFICYIYAEQWDDDGFFEYALNKYYKQ